LQLSIAVILQCKNIRTAWSQTMPALEKLSGKNAKNIPSVATIFGMR
jgi:hypothetical protein